ncbi:Piso0_000731 [Millerozyma farinosa CBS 7064]|uniref:Piso0_000731 protein n=1 Tax=Pichia sorbitophila (strain ATCC MYA-4447 / BCRC 22081 / CBS 7064 / NBRC 10061 / NRRL Y-12695) TaxID=559304 RepID=G8YRD0_PICSO|nr:Piso0_000731 [Millerozyma farinosa CBS 7064]
MSYFQLVPVMSFQKQNQIKQKQDADSQKRHQIKQKQDADSQKSVAGSDRSRKQSTRSSLSSSVSSIESGRSKANSSRGAAGSEELSNSLKSVKKASSLFSLGSSRKKNSASNSSIHSPSYTRKPSELSTSYTNPSRKNSTFSEASSSSSQSATDGQKSSEHSLRTQQESSRKPELNKRLSEQDSRTKSSLSQQEQDSKPILSKQPSGDANTLIKGDTRGQQTDSVPGSSHSNSATTDIKENQNANDSSHLAKQAQRPEVADKKTQSDDNLNNRNDLDTKYRNAPAFSEEEELLTDKEAHRGKQVENYISPKEYVDNDKSASYEPVSPTHISTSGKAKSKDGNNLSDVDIKNNNQKDKLDALDEVSSSNSPTNDEKREELRSVDSTTSVDLNVLEYQLVSDLSVFNTWESMKKSLYFPTFQEIRYHNFLNVLSGQHRSDPVSYATDRRQSLTKFIKTFEKSNEVDYKSRIEKRNDTHYYEVILGSIMLNLRELFKEIIRKQFSYDETKQKLMNHDEILQVNVSNYIHFLFGLPSIQDLRIRKSQLKEMHMMHYTFKALFEMVGEELYALKKDELVSVEDRKEAIQHCVSDAFRKEGFEFLRLETFLLQILAKLGNNLLIDNRHSKVLFDIYSGRMKSNNQESIKILNYNLRFSAQNSWCLALTVPFVKVVEMSIASEENDLINDYKQYHENSSKVIKTDFMEQDEFLFHNYFKLLGFHDFESYRSASYRKLVKLHKSISSSALEQQKYKIGLARNSAIPGFNKPINFQYYPESLATLKSETFHLIQSRDLFLQLTRKNYSTVLNEFHRILKTGGVLELPYLQTGSNISKEALEQGTSSIPDIDINSDQLKKFNLIPSFTSTIIKKLNQIFGSQNVKVGFSVLSSKNDIFNHLYENYGAIVHSAFDSLNDFYARYADSIQNKAIDKDKELFYLIHIRAQKS